MKQGENVATSKSLNIYKYSSIILTLLLIIMPFLSAYYTATSSIAALATPEQLSEYIAQTQGNAIRGSIAANIIEAVTIWRYRIEAAVMISIISIVLVTINIRKFEERRKPSLVQAKEAGIQVSGIKIPVTAIMIKAYITNLLGAVTMALGFISAGFPMEGSFTAGFSIALCGCTFVAITGILAQITSNMHLVRGVSLGLLASFLVLMGVANTTGNESLLLFTPIGWCTYSLAFAGRNYWLLLFAVLLIALLTFLEYGLSD